MRSLTLYNRSNQRGAVLVGALILLLAVTALTTSMFGNVGLQERASGNQLDKTRARHAASSALREHWINLLNLNPGENAIDARTRSHPATYDQDLDGDPATQEVDLTVDVDICFAGTTFAPGTDTSFQAYMFQLDSNAVDQDNAASQIRQGGYVVAPAPPVPLAANCP
jgi:Tfp pilus assembly protein PilX